MQYILISLFCFVYLQGAISEHIFGVSYAKSGAPDSIVSRFLVEASVALAVLWTLFHRRVKMPSGWQWLALYGIWALVSAWFAGDSLQDGFLYARYSVYALLMYYVGWNIRLPYRHLKRIGGTIVALMTLQLVAALIKVMLLHDRTEWRVGTMVISGGELAAIFPLFALSCAMGYYFYARRSVWILVLGLAFGIVGYASGKRAIYFYTPVALTLNCSLYALLGTRRQGPVMTARNLTQIAVCVALAFPAVIFGITRSKGIGDNFGGDTSVQTIQHAVEYAEAYDRGAVAGFATGRASASERVLKSFGDVGTATVLMGWGPAALTARRGQTKDTANGFRPLRIWYGIVGWSRDAISVGIVGVLLYISAFLSVAMKAGRSLSRTDLTAYERAATFSVMSGALIVILSYVHYGSAFMTNGTITFVLLFSAGVVFSKPKTRNVGKTPLPENPRFTSSCVS